MTEAKIEFETKLTKAIQRALSRWLHAAFSLEIITQKGFIDHIKIETLITKLSAAVRGKVFGACVKSDPEFAAKLDASVVAATIGSALQGGLVTPADICKEITTDHMVEVLSSQELYRLMFGKPDEKKRWLHEDKASASSKSFMAFVHKVIQQELVLGKDTATQYMKELGDAKVIHEKTPPTLLAHGQVAMIEKYRANKLFTDADLIAIYTPSELVNYVDLSDLFPVVEAVARENSWIIEVPAPPKTEIPAGALDSVAPPAPSGEPKPEDEEPVMVVDGAGTGEELVLVDEDEAEKTNVVDRADLAPGGRMSPRNRGASSRRG
jgi:hypothetical protein